MSRFCSFAKSWLQETTKRNYKMPFLGPMAAVRHDETTKRNYKGVPG